MKLILTINCQTNENLKEVIEGRMDTELNDHGRQQAEALAKRLVGLNVKRIVTSTMKRGIETARIVAQKLELEFLTDEKLTECSFGRLEGLKKKAWRDEAGHRNRDEALRMGVVYDFTEFGGETGKSVLGRHVSVLMHHSHGLNHNEALLLIGHRRGLRTFLSALGHADVELPQGELIMITLEPDHALAI